MNKQIAESLIAVHTHTHTHTSYTGSDYLAYTKTRKIYKNLYEIMDYLKI